MIVGCFLTQLISIAKQENKSIESVIAHLVPRGLAATDPCIDLVHTLGADYINKLHKEHDLKVASTFHLIDFLHKEPAALKQIYADIKAHLEACASIGSPYFMPVTCIAEEHKSEAARQECLNIVTDYVATLAEAAKSYGITIVIENYSRLRTPLSKISDIAHILGEVPEVRYVLDTGNFWFGGTDLMEACHAFIDKTVHVHAKDLGEPDFVDLDIHGRKADGVAVGDGFLAIREVVETLQKKGYDGALTIETVCGRDLLKKTEDSLDYLVQFI